MGNDHRQESERPADAYSSQKVKQSLIEFPYLDDEDYVCANVGRDLTYEAYVDLIYDRASPIRGRDREMSDLLMLLSRPGMRNVIILGPSGVGKTVLVEGLAQCIVKGQAPPNLRKTRIIATSFSEIWGYVGDSDNWGKYIKILKEIVSECQQLPAVLFMDEIHAIFAHRYSVQFVLPRLSRGELTIIGATTDQEYLTFIEPQPAVARRFHLYRLKEPSRSAVEEMIMESFKGRYKGVSAGSLLSRAEMRYLISQSDTYMPFEYHPAKALRLIDKILAVKTLAGDSSPIKREEIRRAVADSVGIPVEAIAAPVEQIQAMENVLNAHILGQQEAIARLCRRLIIARARTTVHRDRPQGVFLLAGPTGVGKTELAKALAAYLNGSDRELVRLDMSTYSSEASIHTLLGVPGVSSTEVAQRVPAFTRMVKEHPYGVLLLDEIEKAHPSVILLFLHAFDTGRMVDVLGNPIDLRNMVILMTTNLGFSVRQPIIATPGQTVSEIIRQEEAASLKMIRQYFPSEFLGRLDEILFFKPLTHEVMRGFIGQKLRRLEDAIEKRIHLSEDAMSFLCEQAFHPEYGARDLNRAMDNLLGYPLALLRFHSDETWEKARSIKVSLNSSKGELVAEIDKLKRRKIRSAGVKRS